MTTVWQRRLTQAVGKYGEQAPMATVCCNACRTCVQTNLIAAASAVVLAGGAALVGLGKRIVRSA